jgi:hypothetical protein
LTNNFFNQPQSEHSIFNHVKQGENMGISVSTNKITSPMNPPPKSLTGYPPPTTQTFIRHLQSNQTTTRPTKNWHFDVHYQNHLCNESTTKITYGNPQLSYTNISTTFHRIEQQQGESIPYFINQTSKKKKNLKGLRFVAEATEETRAQSGEKMFHLLPTTETYSEPIR